MGVVRPRSTADTIATIQYAAENNLPVHARGAGSGVAGESLGPGLVIDFSRFMRRIRLSDDGQTVWVQSGSVLAEVNRSLKTHGRWYGPDPATRSITTMGSVLSTNASGSHYLRSGSARDTVESVEFVSAEGEAFLLSSHHPSEPGTLGRWATGITEIAKRFAKQIEKRNHSAEPQSGFRLDDIIAEDGYVDLAKFVVGTQGTLGLITSATLRTEAIPTHRGVALLFFRRLDSAARCAVKSLSHGPVACDMLDRRLLQIARETDQRFVSVLPREAEAMLLIEIQGESLGDLYDRLGVLRQDLAHGSDGAFSSVDTVKRSERDLYWALCRRVIPRLYRVKGSSAPLPIIEDIAVAPDRLPTILHELQKTLRRLETTATVFAHAGQGHLNLRPFLNLGDEEDRKKLATLSGEIAELVWKYDGEVGVAHAAGLSRSHLLPRQFGDYWQTMGQIKRLFDPMHRMNPGKLFGAVLQRPDERLRPADQTIEIVRGDRTLIEADHRIQENAEKEGTAVPRLSVLQDWSAGESVASVARSCNGCGRCRTASVDERQCPMFRASHREEASPRAKANLLRGVLSGQLSVEDLNDDRAKDVADLCFNCHQCRVDCPASVDIPKIVGEIKAQYVATNGLPLSDMLLGRIDQIALVASKVPWLANVIIRSRASRWVAERLFGLSASRELPPITSETFLKHASRRRWTRNAPHGGLKIAYFVDHYANYHDPMTARALVEILQHNSIGVFVPSAQVASGMARFSAGDIKGARRVARRNLRVFSEAVRQGYTVLTTEPAALLCLKHEYPNLIDDQDAHLVAQHSSDACDYLWNLHREDRLSLDFQPIQRKIHYHQPCHLRAIDPEKAGPQLMGLIPDLEIDCIDAGCTGMAGTWGLQRKNYRNSLRVGWPLISAMRKAPGVPEKTFAASECSACRMQIEHAASRETIHPLKLLAFAYGKLPRLEQQLGES